MESDSGTLWRVGTSGWSYPPRTGAGTWTGVFYPPKKTDELQFYSQYFNTVEINSTFYRPCAPATAESWAQRTQSDFEFTAKAWQQFTHTRDPILQKDVDVFRAGLAPLVEAGKLGCLLFQFPASFHCDDDTRDRLRALLGLFADYPTAAELRHRSWDENREILDDTNTVSAFIDEPKFRDSTREHIRARAGVLYVRFHGRRAGKWWSHEHRDERYDYLYSKEEVHEHANRLQLAAAEQRIRKAYAFFNNHPGGKAVVNAVMLRRELGAPVTEGLPDSLVAKFPEIALE